VPEAAARERSGVDSGVKPGDLVHVPFFEVRMKLGTVTVTVSVEACSGQISVDAIPRAGAATGAGRVMTLALGGLVMLTEAALLPWLWVAVPAVAVTAWLTRLAMPGGARDSIA
jgi:hypothetical protein